VAHFPVIVLVDALHYQFHQQRTFITQFPEIDVHAGMRKVAGVLVLQEVFHLDVEHFRFMGVLGVERKETAVLADNGEVRFARKALCRGFHPDYVLRTVRLACYDVVASQIHVADGGGEDDMHRLGKSHFHAVGCHHLAVREFPGNALIQVVACYIFYSVSGLCVCRTHAQQEGEHYKNLFHC